LLKIELDVFTDNEIAIGLYKKLVLSRFVWVNCFTHIRDLD